MERPEDNLLEMIFSLHHMRPERWTQEVRLGGGYFYRLSRLVDP